MKTPREVLLEQHRDAESKLDAARREALNIIANNKHRARRKKKVFNPAAIPPLIWRELVLPCRRIWAGLAAVWVLIFALHFATRDTSPALAISSARPSPEMLAALQNQKQLLAEMLMDGPKSSDADRPKPPAPSPHSELMMPVVGT